VKNPGFPQRAAGPIGALLLSAAAVGGCATPPADPAERAVFVQNNDPLEPLNRKVLEVNQLLDRILFRPVAKAYIFALPEDARTAIHHVLDNMKEPTLFFNNALQGEFRRAGITLGRFVINSTVGFGGIIDVATLSGVERQPADFGQTLFVWGFPSGPYLVLPILGPSNPRDAGGSLVDSYADPFTILATAHGVTELTTGRLITGGVDSRVQVMDVLDELEKNSVDLYAQLRSLSQQHRASELRNGAAAPDTAPSLYNDPGRPPAGAGAKPALAPAGPAPAPKPASPRPTPAAPATTNAVPAALPTPLTPAAPPPLQPAAVRFPPPPAPLAPARSWSDPDEGPLR